MSSGAEAGPLDHGQELERITDFMGRARPNCEICFGGALVCEEHPTMPWEGNESAPPGTACPCGQPGMPCKCTLPVVR